MNVTVRTLNGAAVDKGVLLKENAMGWLIKSYYYPNPDGGGLFNYSVTDYKVEEEKQVDQELVMVEITYSYPGHTGSRQASWPSSDEPAPHPIMIADVLRGLADDLDGKR